MMPPSPDGKSSSPRYSNIYRAVRQACFEQPSEKTFLEPWIHAYSRKFPPTPARSSSFSPSSRASVFYRIGFKLGMGALTVRQCPINVIVKWNPGGKRLFGPCIYVGPL